MSKKIVLSLIIATEIFLGAFFLFQYYQYRLEQKKVLGISRVSKIDKENTTSGEYEDLEYYWGYKPNQKHEDNPPWLPYKVIYNINGDALNDVNDYSIEKDEDTYRIITLGDSFTYGHFVDTKDNWTEQLEVLLNESIEGCKYKRIEVINLGMPGFDIQYIVRRYQEIGQKYNPDLVLWFESGFGFTRQFELMQPIINKCIEESSDSNSIGGKNGYYPCWSMAQKQINQEYSTKELNKMVEHQYDKFFNLVDQNKVITFYYDNLTNDNKKTVNGWKRMYSEATFIPLVPALTKEERLVDNHPNKEGHKTIALNILQYLKNERDFCQ